MVRRLFAVEPGLVTSTSMRPAWSVGVPRPVRHSARVSLITPWMIFETISIQERPVAQNVVSAASEPYLLSTSGGLSVHRTQWWCRPPRIPSGSTASDPLRRRRRAPCFPRRARRRQRARLDPTSARVVATRAGLLAFRSRHGRRHAGLALRLCRRAAALPADACRTHCRRSPQSRHGLGLSGRRGGENLAAAAQRAV